MSRGRTRSRGQSRRRRTRKLKDINAPTVRQSQASQHYADGMTVKYKNRIRGPVSKITKYSIDDLPEDSALRQRL